MMPLLVCLAASFLVAAPQAAATPTSADPRAVLARAVDALGGEAALKAIAGLQIDAIGHDYFIDQSERPEGPFITRYAQTTERRDVAHGRSRIETQSRFTQVPDWSGAGSAVSSISTARRKSPARAPSST